MKRKIQLFTILFSVVFLILISFANAQSGKKAVFIIASENFQDDEFAQPLAVFKDNGISVTVASTTTNEVTGMNGATTTPDVLLDTIKAEDFDAVVFIGGSGAAQYIDDPMAHKLVQDAIEQNKVLGAICLAPRILASAGVLTGKNATVYPTEGEKLKEAGVNYTANPVEQDGNIITADGPGSAKEFGEALAGLLK
ncbi:MAG: DJ-1/PfpI family protein [Candidatus Omnitrophica bacterium]|nr:DJ-1/PfpI family protein [Candidatus Omnitrophota bacterium]MBU1995775.1 DJ-1/PfpI family protein [Candidatus Omnitrophota bacterium]MBU4333224.1 DJ-1/PfpI family protein [Candidatus Omnitrophota bacterium]